MTTGWAGLEALAPAADQARGQLLLTAVREFAVAGASLLHLDLTAVRFAGAFEDSAVVTRGWAAGRTIARQVKTLQAATPSGVSGYFRPPTGSSSDLPAFTAAIEVLPPALPPGRAAVADS